jgi:hypothetical protein
VHTRVTCTYGSKDSKQSFNVPAGVDQIHAQIYGAQGGSGPDGDSGHGGYGGGVGGYIPVLGGQIIDMLVGTQGGLSTGGGGWPDGGAGGSAHTGRTQGCGGGGSTQLSLRMGSLMMVAGAGGGCGGATDSDYGVEGANGGSPGANGRDAAWQSDGLACSAKGTPGNGGTTSGGGAHGAVGEYYDWGSATCPRGASGTAPSSGSFLRGGTGGEAQGGASGGGGGGGGGYYGGGGGGGGNSGAGGTGGGGPGGGGANWYSSNVVSPSVSSGVRSGGGLAIIWYDLANTTTSVTVGPELFDGAVAVGSRVTITAVVSADNSFLPRGKVAYSAVRDGVTTQLCPGTEGQTQSFSTVGNMGRLTATCTTTLHRGGPTTFHASYSPNGAAQNGPAATPSSGSVNSTLAPIATTTSLVKTVVGGVTNLVATVSDTDPLTPIAGSVTFSSGDVPAGCLALPVIDNNDGTATATCELQSVPGTSLDFVAAYTGDLDTADSVSAPPLTVSVDRLATSTSVALGSGSLSFGQVATATATVTSIGGDAAFDGTVTFNDVAAGGGTTVACANVPIVDRGNGTGQAQCAWQPSGGGHTVVADFSGGAQVDASSSPASSTLTVAKATPVLVLTANPPSGSIAGQQVGLTVSVKAAGHPVSQGSATFFSGGVAIPGCSAVAIVAGAALCTLVPEAGNRTFTVTTSATADLDAASAPLSGTSKIYHVGLHPTTTDLALTAPTPTPATIPAGTAITVTATVGGVYNPPGEVAFNDNGQPVAGCTARPLTTGVATCTWTPLAGVAHSVTAAYSGSSTAASSTTATPLSLTTGRFASSVALTVSPGGTSAYGVTTTLSADVSSAGPTATGTVTFTDGGVAIDSCGAPSAQAATCALKAAPGTHSYRAVYSGDTATAPATSSAATATTQSLATSMTLTATQGDGDLALSAHVEAPSATTVSPTGTVNVTLDGSIACSADLVADPTGGATATCRVTADVAASHDVAATFVPTDPTAYGTATATTTFTPATSCSPGLDALVSGFTGGSTRTISAGALGSVSVTPTGSVGPCTGATSIGVSVSASLFNGTLTATGLTGSITAGGGFCLESGSFTLPSSWHAPTVSISTPICFAVGDTGSITGISSGGLTASMPAGAFPFVAFPNAPPTSISFGFTTDAGVTTLHTAFLAGPVDNPVVALSFDVAANGAFTGELTTPGLTVLGQSLAGLHVSVSGGNGAPFRFDGSVTLGPIDVAPGLTLTTVTVSVSNDGFSLSGSAEVGVAGHTLSLEVAGTVADAKNWSLSLASSGGPSWEPVSGLQIQPDFAGTVTSTDGAITFSITGGTPGGTALATWTPAPGVTITVDSVSLARPLPSCAAVPDGSNDLGLSFSGSLSLNDTAFAIDGCIDLSVGAFHIEAGAQDVAITSGMTLTGAHLTVDAAVSGAFHVVGGATATVTAGGTDHSLAVAFDFSSDGTLVIGASVDLASWGVPVKGYVAYASNAVTGFDTGDPTVGDDGKIDLAAGLTAAAVWTPGASTVELLEKAGFTLGSGGSISVVATLSPTGSITFHAELASPDGMPFMKLPGGASLTGASLDWADGTLSLVVDATIPMPDGAADATAHLEVVIGTADGTFSGNATLTGLTVFGQTLNLSGSATGTRTFGKLVLGISITAALPGPISMPGVPSITLSDISVTLGTQGIAVAATMSVAGRTGLTINGTLTSMSDWSLTVTSGALSWTPAPQFTVTAQLSGTVSRKNGVITYDLSATNPNGGDLVSFTPVSGFTIGVKQIRLGNATPPPNGCLVSAAGDVWLYVEGSASLQLGPVNGSATASGCFDLTSSAVTITADASQMSVSLLGGAVVISGPKVTVSKAGTTYAVDAEVHLQVSFPTGATLSFDGVLSLRSGGTFIVGVRANLASVLGSVGGNAYLYYSSAAVSKYDTGDPTVGKINLVSGITFAVKLTLPTSVSGELAKIGLTSPGGATLAAVGSLDLSSKVFTLKISFDAGMSGQVLFKTGSGVSLALDSGYLKLTVSAGAVAFGLGLEATLHVPSGTSGGEASDVGLVGEITISTKELSVSLQLGDCHSGVGWQNAFGVDGLTVQCAAVQGGVSLEGPPLPSFGLMGTITSLPQNVADTVGYVNGSPMSFAFNLDPFLLSISIGTQDSGKVALRPLTMFGAPDAMQVYYASLYISPTGATIGQEVYPAGFGFGFQGSIAGVTVNVLAKVDPVKMSLSFDGSVSQFTVGPLTIGPVSLHFKASPTTFEFTFDGSMQLGPGEVDLGLIKIGGQLGATVHLSVSTSAISAWFTANVSAYVAAYLSHETCYYKGVLPYPCDWYWEKTGFDFTLGKTGFTLDSSGLTISFDGYSLTLPFDGGSPTSSQVAYRGDTPDPKTALWDPVAPPTIHVAPYSPPPSRTLTA